jgi:hypothetical protein
MTDSTDALIAWRRKELDASEQQIELFGAKGVKAVLVLPDGVQQDITDRVLKHQREYALRLLELIVALDGSAR